MRRRESNDNWKQLLIKLERLGVKPWFIHRLTTDWNRSHLEYVRTQCSQYTPRVLFTLSIAGGLYREADRVLAWEIRELL